MHTHMHTHTNTRTRTHTHTHTHTHYCVRFVFKSYLQTQVKFLEGASDLGGEHVHAFTLLEGDDDVGRPVLRLAHDLHHVELLRQLL